MENKKTKSVFLLIAEDGRSFKAYNEAAFLARFCNPTQQKNSTNISSEGNIKQKKDAWAELGIPAINFRKISCPYIDQSEITTDKFEDNDAYKNYYGEVK